MKRLLLLFILSPVISFGQMRRGAIVDSIKAHPTDLKAAIGLINNNERTKVEQIQASDSGGYITMVVRVRINEAIAMATLSYLPVTPMKTTAAVASVVKMVRVSLPAYIPPPNIDALVSQPVHSFNIVDRIGGKIATRTVPPLPCLPSPDVDMLTLHPAKVLKTRITTASKGNALIVPPFLKILLGPLDPIELSDAISFAIHRRPAKKIDTAVVPHYEPEKKMPVEEMHLSPEGYSLLEKLEGFSPNLYALKDGGLTIGFGFFVPYGEGNKWNKGVTWEEAERIMKEKVPTYEDQVKQYINVPLTQSEFDALTMIAYNLGGFSKATSIVNDINGEADFEKLQKDWMRFVHSKAPGVMKGLMNRRKDELNVRNARDYQPDRKIQILKNIK